jgi:iron complex outermembrane recepter protein
MREVFHFKKKLLTRLVLGSLFATSVNASFAQGAVDLGTVQSGSGTMQVQNSAPYQAPSQGSLVSTQPQSIISQHYIEQNASATSNYTDIVNVSPAVSSIDPNGPGMMETQSLSMRGFTDGQFNVTFDGIPWGDSNDFTHHSTSYFTAQDIGNIVVDRGPGDASNIGDATFGGTIAVQSKDPMSSPAFTPYVTLGSFNTRMVGAEFDTGAMQNYNDASAFIDYKQISSDGFMTNGNQKRSNLFLKVAKPVSSDTVLTFVVMYNKLHQNVPLGTTAANLAKYGYDFGLNSDPTSQDYFGYNYDNITGDMEYVDLNTRQGDWKIDNKLYSYAYFHNGYNGADPGLGQANGTGYGINNVPGQEMFMNYRSYGDILRTSAPMGPGDLGLGAWVDHQTNDRAQWNVDFTLGGALDPTLGGVNGYSRLMHDTLTTFQPYVQYAWKVTDALTVTPGLKYSSFKRTDDSPINQGTKAPLYASQTWSKVLPALVAHYTIQPDWTAYAQYAQGFLAPNLNTFYQANAITSTMKPTQTANYQIGTTWKDRTLSVSGDVYRIVSSNWMNPTPQGNTTVFTDAGDVDFSGAEAEATYYVGSGVSLYGNYALISYDIKNPALFGSSVLNYVPRNTAAAGAMFNQGPVYASLIAKETGPEFGNVDVNGNPLHFGGYTVANFNTSYTINNDGNMIKNLKLGFQINNLFNRKGTFTSINSDANGNPMYYVIPTRNYEISLSGSM